MNTTLNKQLSERIIGQNALAYLVAEIQELEDIYAECLGDDVDAKTLTMLWLRIKTIKTKMDLA